MLTDLTIANFAIIEKAQVAFPDGMTTVTGETGAGKSIILDALLLCLGQRANQQVVRPEQSRCDVTATFDVLNNREAKQWLADNALDEDELCIVRRSVDNNGRSKAFINGHPCTLQQLKTLSGLLVNLHGQHDQQRLLKAEHQRAVLDNFSGSEETVTAISALYQQWHNVHQQLVTLQETPDSQARCELLAYQLEELEQLNLQAGEVETLHETHKLAATVSERLEVCQQALTLLEENTLQQASAVLQKFANTDPKLATIHELLNNSFIQAQEATADLQHYAESIDADPEKLQTVSTRLDQTHKLARKHQVQPELLHEKQQTIAEELDNLQNSEARIAELNTQLEKLAEQYQKAAKQLHQARVKSAKELSKKITDCIQKLGMPGGKVELSVTFDIEKDPTPHGLDTIAFMVSANPGHPLQALNKVASGGELSRISLAIEVVSQGYHATPTLIFDEVDVGIGGGTAEVVGQLLQQLGTQAQVICITHLPQVAACGNHHLKVAKETKAGSTVSHIETLTAKQRTEEIARMLGGVKITKQTLAHAEEMLG